MTKTKAVTIDSVCDQITTFTPNADLELVRNAYTFAEDAHQGQTRHSGEPYIIHPVEVAYSLAGMRLDLSSIVAGLLHDTVEDTPVTLEDVEKQFGKDVAEIVDGVTKISKITFKTTEEKQAENFRKMIVAMANDIRVILVKLADRLNNMRTLDALIPHKQQRIAQETLDIYAPIANRLGMSTLKSEFEDLCLRYLHPDVYYRLARKITKTKKERDKYIEEVTEILREKLQEYDVEASIEGRAKHFWSIFRKMERRNADFEQIYDIIAFRIVTDNITECYKALGIIHATYKPVPGRFKDYIAMPKANGYQSLHTTVIGPYGERVEIQIRTEEMHNTAELGIAAHWKYKEGKFDRKQENSRWVNRLLQWHKDLSDPNEFLETVKIDLFAEDVFVFTPKGEVKELPHGATPLDFAYTVHTDVGNKCIGAKVNGKIVPLKYRLKSGDTVEVLTSPSQSPSKDWLKIVRSSRAKAKIRAFIKQQERERAIELGQEMLEGALKPYSISLSRANKSGETLKVAQGLKLKTLDELFVGLGYGRLLIEDVIEHFVPEEKRKREEKEVKEEEENLLKRVFRRTRKPSDSKNAIQVANLDDVLVRFAKCCSPVPGDSIIGFITRGRGVTVHVATCPKALDTDQERRVDVQWNRQSKTQLKRTVKVRVLASDSQGLLAEMSQSITGCGVNITSAVVRSTKDQKAIALFTIEVESLEQLHKVTQTLEAKKNVISVARTRS